MTERELAQEVGVRHNYKADMLRSDPYFATIVAALNEPEKYKVCLACGLIIEKKEHVCTYCNAYLFDESPEAISNAALDQATQKESIDMLQKRYARD